jgi:hypothetical protein
MLWVIVTLRSSEAGSARPVWVDFGCSADCQRMTTQSGLPKLRLKTSNGRITPFADISQLPPHLAERLRSSDGDFVEAERTPLLVRRDIHFDGPAVQLEFGIDVLALPVEPKHVRHSIQ